MISSEKRDFGLLKTALRIAVAIGVATFSTGRLQADDESPWSVHASIDYLTNATLYGSGNSGTPSGFTVQTLPSQNAGKTSICVSMAILSRECNLADYRLVAVTRDGKTIEQTQGSASAGVGRDIVTATFLAEFPTFRNNIERLRIERRNPVPSANSSSNSKPTAMRKGVRPDLPSTRWGSIADLDRDCEIAVTDEKLNVVIPDRFHELNPTAGNNAPSALNRVGGDFTFQVKVTGTFQPGEKSQNRGAPFNGAGILIWESERNYLRIERNAYWASESKLVCHFPLIEHWFQHEERGANTRQVGSDAFQGESTWLKVRRQGKSFAISVSQNGKDWSEIKTLSCEMSDDVYVGVAAINTSNKPFRVEFSEHQLQADRRLQDEPSAPPAPLATASATPKVRVRDFSMDISNRQVTNAELYRLCNESNLTILKASHTSITDEGLKEVVRATMLKSLDLSETQITDAGLKQLGQLKNLAALELAGLNVTDAGLRELGNAAELRSISLRNTQVTDAGLAGLNQFPKLISLDLSGTPVTDAGLVETGKHPQIVELGLGSTKITDAGLKNLSPLNNLSKLELFLTSVTDEGLKAVASSNG